MSLTGVNQSWLKPLMKLVQHESGGNPNARNDTPVASGQHAQGLLQTIPSTFDAYNMNRLGNDITDPVQNAVAAIRYIMSRYGHVRKTPLFTEGGGGY
jgi:SLT domain-containing protein